MVGLPCRQVRAADEGAPMATTIPSSSSSASSGPRGNQNAALQKLTNDLNHASLQERGKLSTHASPTKISALRVATPKGTTSSATLPSTPLKRGGCVG